MKERNRVDYSKKFSGNDDDLKNDQYGPIEIEENVSDNVEKPKEFVGRVKLEGKNDRLNVRQGPDVKYETIKEIRNGDELMVIGGFEDTYAWYRVVTASGIEGYVMKNYIAIED